jgi:hypothetical protein
VWSQGVVPDFSSGMEEKLIELACECEEIYDMSHKKYSDGVWKEKLWGQIGEQLKKKSVILQLRILKFQSFYYNGSPNN